MNYIIQYNLFQLSRSLDLEGMQLSVIELQHQEEELRKKIDYYQRINNSQLSILDEGNNEIKNSISICLMKVISCRAIL